LLSEAMKSGRDEQGGQYSWASRWMHNNGSWKATLAI